MYGIRRFRRRPSAPNNAIEEGHNMAGMGDLPEDMLMERRSRPPILTPRGNGTDNPFEQMPFNTAPPPATRSFNPAQHSTYAVIVPAAVAVQIFAATRERPYSLVVNSGANDAVIAYGRAPADITDGIPLASGGVGFHELVNGTTSTLWAFSTTGTTIIVTEGRYDPPMEG